MKIRTSLLTSFALFIAFFGSARAEMALNVSSQIGVSNFGLMLTPEVSVNDTFAIRVPISMNKGSQMNMFNFADEIFGQGIAGVGMAGAWGVLVDIPSPREQMSFTGGVMFPEYKIEGSENLTGKAAYLGLAHELPLSNALSLNFDTGALYDFAELKTPSGTTSKGRFLPYFSVGLAVNF